LRFSRGSELSRREFASSEIWPRWKKHAKLGAGIFGYQHIANENWRFVDGKGSYERHDHNPDEQGI
jgi:hypothetical protein